MPAPQVTATPQARPLATESGSPARSTAKVSLTTEVCRLQPSARIAAQICSSSSGRSALARQAKGCPATGEPGTRGPSVMPAAAATCSTSPASILIVTGTPSCGASTPGPRTVASSVPSAATSAPSFLLFPPSTARTVGNRSGTAGPRQVAGVLGEQQVGEPPGQVGLADQRVGQHGHLHPLSAAAQGRLDRELLVGADGPDQAALQRPDRIEGHRDRAVGADRGRHPAAP